VTYRYDELKRRAGPEALERGAGVWLRPGAPAGEEPDWLCEEYAYDGDNRRVWKRKLLGDGQYRQEVYFYAPGGERLGTYRLARNGAALAFETVADNLYFNGRLIRSGHEVVALQPRPGRGEPPG
jgi:hypothetical protein